MSFLKRVVSVVMILSIILMAVTQFANAETKPKEILPTIFFHGFNGSHKTFSDGIINIVKTTKDEDGGPQYDGTVGFKKDGTFVDTREKKNENTTKPLIVAVLEDNKQSISYQLEHFKKIVAYVKNKYNAKRVNLVGHSTGGIVAVEYVLSTKEDDVNSMLLIATPLTGTRYSSIPELLSGEYLTKANKLLEKYPNTKDLISGSDALKFLDKSLKETKLNKNIKVHCFRGRYDMVVSKKSSFALEKYDTFNSISYNTVNAFHVNIPDKITSSEYINALYK